VRWASLARVVTILGVLALPACDGAHSSNTEPRGSQTGLRVASPTQVVEQAEPSCPMQPERHPPPGELRPLSAVFDPTQPLLIDGQTADLDGWSTHAAFPLYVPNDPNLPPPQLWVIRDGQRPQYAGVRYACQLALTYTRWQPRTDVATQYRLEARQWNVGYATTINGHPAWVRPPNRHSLDRRIASVNLTIGSLEVSMLAIMPVDRLLADAASLHLAGSSQ
jgi:hypothetical protein